MIHTVKGFSVVNETEVDIFLESPRFLCDPVNVGSLISGSSVFSKPSLNIWKFSVHVMPKPSLLDFEHSLTSMGDEWNCLVVWTFFSIALLGNWDGDWPFPVLWSLLGFPNMLTYSVWSTLIVSCLRIPSPPLALLAAVLSKKAHLTSHSRMSDSKWKTTSSWLSRSLRSFLYTVLLCILFISSWSLLLHLGLSYFCPLLCPSLDKMFLWYFQFSWRDL